jgi:hypothetical protein
MKSLTLDQIKPDHYYWSIGNNHYGMPMGLQIVQIYEEDDYEEDGKPCKKLRGYGIRDECGINVEKALKEPYNAKYYGPILPPEFLKEDGKELGF